VNRRLPRWHSSQSWKGVRGGPRHAGELVGSGRCGGGHRQHRLRARAAAPFPASALRHDHGRAREVAPDAGVHARHPARALATRRREPREGARGSTGRGRRDAHQPHDRVRGDPGAPADGVARPGLGDDGRCVPGDLDQDPEVGRRYPAGAGEREVPGVVRVALPADDAESRQDRGGSREVPGLEAAGGQSLVVALGTGRGV
jgi:hypothetical protein